jgi:hypothetical protein
VVGGGWGGSEEDGWGVVGWRPRLHGQLALGLLDFGGIAHRGALPTGNRCSAFRHVTKKRRICCNTKNRKKQVKDHFTLESTKRKVQYY